MIVFSDMHQLLSRLLVNDHLSWVPANDKGDKWGETVGCEDWNLKVTKIPENFS